MFRTIVVATDLSPASERVLDCVSSWRVIGLRKVVVTHVHNIVSSGGLEDTLRQAHEPKLERQADRLRQAGTSATWRLEYGRGARRDHRRGEAAAPRPRRRCSTALADVRDAGLPDLRTRPRGALDGPSIHRCASGLAARQDCGANGGMNAHLRVRLSELPRAFRGSDDGEGA